MNTLTQRTMGPDFFCVGAQKGGTGWLYEQLRSHPDFWMPPVKELHYFDRLWRSPQAARKPGGRINLARRRARDERDLRFLEVMETLAQNPDIDLDRYADLFSSKGPLLSGDITPGYSTLESEMIEQIIRRFPEAKITFLARDPVERAWSHLSMWVRQEAIAPFHSDDLDRITQHLRRPEVERRSYPSKIVGSWRQHVRPELFRVYFFDDLKRDSAELRGSIVEFLGGDAGKRSGELAVDHNTKGKREKLDLTESVRSHLARFFERELKACADELGGPARDWPARYGF